MTGRMVVGRAELELSLAGCQSLKDKRQILRSMMDRLRQRYQLAVAEVGAQDLWSRAVIGLACVSNDGTHARQVMEEAMRFIEGDGRCEITGREVSVG